MMPLAPTPIVPVPSKPKIGFSIDSIVGGGRTTAPRSLHHEDDSSATRLMDIDRDGALSPADAEARIRGPARSPGARSEGSDRPASRGSSVESYSRHRQPPAHRPHLDYGARSLTKSHSHSGGSSPGDSPSPPPAHKRASESPTGHPQPPPGVVRPSPNYLGPPPTAAVAAEQLKSLYGLPGVAHAAAAAAAAAGPQAQSEYHSHNLALAANLAAAQHFQAANLAVALQAHHGSPHGPYPHGAPGGPHPPPHPHQPPRDSYPLYPWLLSRHGRIFPQRFPGGTYELFFSTASFLVVARIRAPLAPTKRQISCFVGDVTKTFGVIS